MEKPGARLRVIAGAAFGATSPVEVLSPTLYVDADLEAGATLTLTAEHQERAVYVADGGARIEGTELPALQMAVLAKTGKVTWAGPALCEGFGADDKADAADGHGPGQSLGPDDIMEACFDDMITGQGEGAGWRQLREAPSGATASIADSQYPKRAGGTFTVKHATLWGGNLAVLSSMVGTPFLPLVKGGILFLEDVAEHPYRIERMLTQLLHAGILGAQKAIVLGQFTEYKQVPHDKGFKLQTVVNWLRSQVKAPVLTNLPFGHVPTKLCLPLGRKVNVVVQGRDVFMMW